jgi:hypothetical protein
MLGQAGQVTLNSVGLFIAQTRHLLYQVDQVEGLLVLRLKSSGLGLGPGVKVRLVRGYGHVSLLPCGGPGSTSRLASG